jgi:hypothetical protein
MMSARRRRRRSRSSGGLAPLPEDCAEQSSGSGAKQTGEVLGKGLTAAVQITGARRDTRGGITHEVD